MNVAITAAVQSAAAQLTEELAPGAAGRLDEAISVEDGSSQSAAQAGGFDTLLAGLVTTPSGAHVDAAAPLDAEAAAFGGSSSSTVSVAAETAPEAVQGPGLDAPEPTGFAGSSSSAGFAGSSSSAGFAGSSSSTAENGVVPEAEAAGAAQGQSAAEDTRLVSAPLEPDDGAPQNGSDPWRTAEAVLRAGVPPSGDRVFRAVGQPSLSEAVVVSNATADETAVDTIERAGAQSDPPQTDSAAFGGSSSSALPTAPLRQGDSGALSAGRTASAAFGDSSSSAVEGGLPSSAGGHVSAPVASGEVAMPAPSEPDAATTGTGHAAPEPAVNETGSPTAVEPLDVDASMEAQARPSGGQGTDGQSGPEVPLTAMRETGSEPLAEGPEVAPAAFGDSSSSAEGRPEAVDVNENPSPGALAGDRPDPPPGGAVVIGSGGTDTPQQRPEPSPSGVRGSDGSQDEPPGAAVSNREGGPSSSALRVAGRSGPETTVQAQPEAVVSAGIGHDLAVGGRVSEAVSATSAPAFGGSSSLAAEESASGGPRSMGRLVRTARLMVRTNGGSARVVLEPPSLGTVRLDITVRDRVVLADVQTQTREAANLVARHVGLLRQALERQGLTVERVDVAAEESSAGDANSGEADDDGARQGQDLGSSADGRSPGSWRWSPWSLTQPASGRETGEELTDEVPVDGLIEADGPDRLGRLVQPMALDVLA